MDGTMISKGTVIISGRLIIGPVLSRGTVVSHGTVVIVSVSPLGFEMIALRSYIRAPLAWSDRCFLCARTMTDHCMS